MPCLRLCHESSIDVPSGRDEFHRRSPAGILANCWEFTIAGVFPEFSGKAATTIRSQKWFRDWTAQNLARKSNGKPVSEDPVEGFPVVVSKNRAVIADPSVMLASAQKVLWAVFARACFNARTWNCKPIPGSSISLTDFALICIVGNES